MQTDGEKITSDFYQTNAQAWTKKHSTPSYWREQHEEFKRLLPSGKTVDLGCGSGNDTAWFLENHYDYIGVDASTEMLSLARSAHPEAKYLEKNLYDLDFAPAEFDGFWAACSLLHIPKQKVGDVLQNIKKIIKPNGIGFIALKDGITEKVEPSKTMQGGRLFALYQEHEFKHVLESNGFKVLSSGRKPYAQNDPTFFIYYFVQV